MARGHFTLILETLIVWTEPDGVDYALSFQDADGCSEVWNFINEVKKHLDASGKSFVVFCCQALCKC